jgi:NTP pyrophosphatase (non-canonical NTP hydrolase)
VDEQQSVAEFVATHDIEAPPAYRLLDLVSEVGELAKDAAESTGYGTDPEGIELSEDEVGDALFALLALAESLDLEADEALATALAKYEDRMQEGGDPASGA